MPASQSSCSSEELSSSSSIQGSHRPYNYNSIQIIGDLDALQGKVKRAAVRTVSDSEGGRREGLDFAYVRILGILGISASLHQPREI